MNTCEGCRYWRALANNGLGGKACCYALDTGRLRMQSPEECTRYEPKVENSNRDDHGGFRRYDDQRALLARLERLRGDLKPDLYRNLLAQIKSFQLYEVAKGLDKIERRLKK